ncbi:MAG: class III poly(R)-hydroxyalkanoic acid synthase subunit PhaE [Proteobacteria bacterium]|nr:class III poly(R)-hydroxyalkanoic acid synthase subunit PhaE [Pseudomonadota bacterium]
MATTQQQSNDWFSAQQQYWDAWFEAQRRSLSGQGPDFSSGFQGPWADFFKEWRNTVFKDQQADGAGAFQQRFILCGEQFLNMMQQFYQATGQAKPIDQMATEWVNTLQQFFTDSLQAASQPFDVSEGYKAFMENLAKAGQAWTSAFQSGKNPFSTFDPLGAFTTMPGLGYTREKQEQWNNLYNQWVEFQRKSRAYDVAMSKIGLEAVQKFQEYLANPPQDQEPLTSLKGIYTKWVDLCEEIYGRYAMSDEYTRLYGEVVNALMAFKQQQNKLTDDAVGQFNLPTRREIDSLHERLQALRREVAELKAVLKQQASLASKKTTKKGKKS